MNVVEVRGAAKRYRPMVGGRPRTLISLFERTPRVEHWALREVSATVANGEAVGLIGANGAGKSTLLRLVAGLTPPTRGSIHVRVQARSLLALGEGFHPVLRAEENVVTEAVLAGLTRREARRRLDAVASFAELEDHMDQQLRTFSDGMRLRLAFSTAISVDPELLLIDEVLAVGDIHFREKCLDRLEELRDTGITIMLASHDLDSVRRLCERVVWLDEGRVRDAGPCADVLPRYEQAMCGGDGSVGMLQDVHGSRPGSKEIEILEVRLLDGDGAAVHLVPSTSSLAVELRYRAEHQVAGATFAITIHSDHDGMTRLELTTAENGCVDGPLEGEGVLVLWLERLDLSGGAYHVDAGVYEPGWAKTYDYVWKAAPLAVLGPGSAGTLAPPHKWTSG